MFKNKDYKLYTIAMSGDGLRSMALYTTAFSSRNKIRTSNTLFWKIKSKIHFKK